MKLPSSQWYWADWMKDPAVRSVSYAARGLWMDMLSRMHENDRRGYLQLNGKPVPAETLARMTGGSTDETSRLLQELEYSGVFSRSDDGTIYSRRMIRDERKRALCSEAGTKGGGNPTLIGRPKGDPKLVPKASSSVAFATSTSKQSQDHSSRSASTDAFFAKAYEQYPRHVGKRAAKKAWTPAVKRVNAMPTDGTAPSAEEFIYQRVITFAAVCERIHKPREFIPHMATWLNQDRFMDDPSEWAVTQNGKPDKFRESLNAIDKL